MTTLREKILPYKEIIWKLYAVEGRNKSYISRLLNVDRKTLTNLINYEWCFEKAQKYHMKPSNQKTLNKYRSKLISLIKKNYTIPMLAEETKLNQSLIMLFLKHDKKLSWHWGEKISRDKEMAQKNKEDMVKNSNLKYDMPDLPNEIWKQIDGFDGYQISNFGRIRSYKVTYDKYAILSIRKNKFGYEEICLQQNGKRKTMKIHRLVAMAFCKKLSDNHNTVNHIDGNKTNNVAQNLEWVTQAENNKHAYDVLNRKRVKVNKIKFKIIYNDKYEFKTVASFARFLGKSETQTRRYIEYPKKYKMNIRKVY